MSPCIKSLHSDYTPTKINVDWSSSEIGWKMADGLANCYFVLCMSSLNFGIILILFILICRNKMCQQLQPVALPKPCHKQDSINYCVYILFECRFNVFIYNIFVCVVCIVAVIVYYIVAFVLMTDF